MKQILVELGRRMLALSAGPNRGPEGADGPIFEFSEAAVSAAKNIALAMLSPEALDEWLAKYPWAPVLVPRNVLIIMAGNIPFVGAHDLICVLAAGHRAIVKPSSKDFASAAWMVAQLTDIQSNTLVEVVNSDLLSDLRPDAVIAMGGDEAVRSIALTYSGLPTLLRGNRSSLAVVTGNETDEQLAALADDVLMYSGLGCRNVSLVFVPRDYDFSRLQHAVSQCINPLDLKYRNNYMQARAMLRMNDAPHIDCNGLLLVENRDFSPQPSVLYYAFYDALPEVKLYVAEHENDLQCVASSSAFDHPRAVPMGRTQHPGLSDYPDGADTMNFLATI